MGSCASKGKSRDLIIAVDRYHMDKLKLNKTGSVEEGPSEKAKLPEPEDPPYYVEEKICVEEQTICIQTSSLGENRNTTEVTTITRDICIQTDRPMKKKKKKKHHEKKDSQEKEIEGYRKSCPTDSVYNGNYNKKTSCYIESASPHSSRGRISGK